MKTQIFIISLLFFQTNVQAEIFRSVDKQGNPVFTDIPSKNSSPVKLKQPSTYKAPSLNASEAPATAESEDVSSAYKQFSVAVPDDGQAFWDNSGDVRVSLALQPALKTKQGHRVQFYLDGVAQGDAVTSLSAVLKNVERGEHTVSAKLLSATGAVIKQTDVVHFQIHRQSLNFPARKKASPGS